MTPAVRISGLGKRYGSVQALDNLSLEVPRGAVFGLLGPNGAGKTTTFGILCNWLSPDAGRAEVLGVSAKSIYTLRGRVAAMPQDALFPPQVPILEQLTHFGRLSGLSRRAAQKEAQEALEKVMLWEDRKKKGRELSHGMRKRAALAQALIGNPELLFLDEPTAGLDPKHARLMKDLVGSLAPQATVLISSHNLAEIQEICTHGAVLDRGRLVASGSIAALTSQGTDISVELEPWDADKLRQAVQTLQDAFSTAAVRQASPTLLTVTCPSNKATSAAVHEILTVLLQHHAPIVSLRRGTSLEQAFLRLTDKSS